MNGSHLWFPRTLSCLGNPLGQAPFTQLTDNFHTYKCPLPSARLHCKSHRDVLQGFQVWSVSPGLFYTCDGCSRCVYVRLSNLKWKEPIEPLDISRRSLIMCIYHGLGKLKDNRQHRQRILGREMALWTMLLSILSLKLFICCLSHMLSYRLPGFKLNPLPALPIKHKGIPDRFLSNTTVLSTWEKLVLSRCFSLRQNTGLGGGLCCAQGTT